MCKIVGLLAVSIILQASVFSACAQAPLNLKDLRLDGDINFDKSKWSRGLERSEMVSDILKTQLISKLTTEEVKSILGEPDSKIRGIWKYFLSPEKNLWLEAHFTENAPIRAESLQFLQLNLTASRIGFSDWRGETPQTDQQQQNSPPEQLKQKILQEEQFKIKQNLNSVLNTSTNEKFNIAEWNTKPEKRFAMIYDLLHGNSIIGMKKHTLESYVGYPAQNQNLVDTNKDSIFYRIDGRCYLQCVLKNDVVSSFRLVFVGQEQNFHSVLKPAMPM